MLGTVIPGRTYNSDGINHQNSNEDDYLRKLFLGGLSANSTEDSIANFYRQFGEVANVVIKRDPVTQRSKGFGFVTYNDPSSIDRAQATKPHIIDGKSVDSKPALPRSEASKNARQNSTDRKIFIGGLKDIHDEESLKQYFQQFGNVLDVKILVDRNTGRKRGFAFVEFDHSDGVDKAAILKNHTINELAVEVKRSNYKHDQARKLAANLTTTMSQNVTSASGPYATTTYPTQTQYTTYPATQTAYNGWAVYPQQTQTTYGAYAAAPTTSDPATTWNGQWAQQTIYGSTPATITTNNWNTAAAPATETYYAQYQQQSYSGGPQKVGYLQGNRMNPYSS